MNKKLEREILDCCEKVVFLEDNFIDLAFEMGPVEGMEPKDIKNYIRYIADWRLNQLNLEPIYKIKSHPLPWLTEILNGVEHANFFEARATEYSKVATSGSWEGKNGVWANFDKKIMSFKKLNFFQYIKTEKERQKNILCVQQFLLYLTLICLLH